MSQIFKKIFMVLPIMVLALTFCSKSTPTDNSDSGDGSDLISEGWVEIDCANNIPASTSDLCNDIKGVEEVTAKAANLYANFAYLVGDGGTYKDYSREDFSYKNMDSWKKVYNYPVRQDHESDDNPITYNLKMEKVYSDDAKYQVKITEAKMYNSEGKNLGAPSNNFNSIGSPTYQQGALALNYVAELNGKQGYVLLFYTPKKPITGAPGNPSYTRFPSVKIIS